MKKQKTQEEFARQLGITRPHLNGVLNKSRKPSPKLAQEIEALMGIPKSELRPDIWPEPQKEAV